MPGVTDRRSLAQSASEARDEIGKLRQEVLDVLPRETPLSVELRSKALRDAYPDAANAPVALEDIAAVAATVLLEDGHVGKAYELTGPETVTRAERVRLIGEALGREIPFVELTHEQAVGQLSAVMGEHAAWYLDHMARLAECPQRAVPTVEEITGRPGTTFAEWAVKHVGTFR